MKTQDIAGQQFGHLTAIERVPAQRVQWRCICECGAETVVQISHLKDGHTQSCGCFRINQITTHGLSKTPEYKVWSSMVERCHNPNDKKFKHYGGRGISVCDLWRASFAAFIADMGRRPKGRLTIERLNNDGNYEPDNCEWASFQKNNLNRRYLGRRSHVRGPYKKKVST